MDNFTYCNPTKIVFGKGYIAQLDELLPREGTILMVYGGGSIKRNGVYEQVLAAKKKRRLVEFAGIEPNPRYETCMKAVKLAKREKAAFILGVGGGSVLDGVKFIAAAARYTGGDPWDIIAKGTPVKAAIPLGSVLTLPATGSEMNSGSVISRESTGEKLFFLSDLVRPVFSILDPETTFTLPARQTANGIADAFVHVMEQYLTYPAAAPLQDRQSEAILATLMEVGPVVMKKPHDYNARATIMWCATNALNNIIGCGVPQDWATHMIGHELTALYGTDHAQSLAIVFPGVCVHQSKAKQEKLLQYGERVLGIKRGTPAARVARTIRETEQFFRSLGMGTRLSDYDIPAEACRLVAARLAKRGWKLGEHQDIGPKEIEKILRLRL
jgi:NADP-dependent alcohol dehydrogenase